MSEFLISFPGVSITGLFANIMTTNGKLFVVIAVILTIFIGLTMYLGRINRKINNLENDE